MADFLTALAGRTLGVVPTVQPNLASMYAPGRDRGGNLASAIAHSKQSAALHEEVAEMTPPQLDASQSLVSPMPKPTLPIARELPSQPARRHHVVDDALEQTQPHDVPPPPAPLYRVKEDPLRQVQPLRAIPPSAPRRVLDEPLSAAPDELLPISTEGAQIEMPSSTIKPATAQVREARIAREQIQSLSSLQRDTRVAGTVQPNIPMSDPAETFLQGLVVPRETRRQDNSPTQHDQHVVTPLVGARETDVRQHVVTPLVGARETDVRQHVVAPLVGARDMGARERDALSSPAPLPTIQVTIGRIEVRATPPPTQRSQTQRPAPAVMSLDEYLNQRAKGGH